MKLLVLYVTAVVVVITTALVGFKVVHDQAYSAGFDDGEYKASREVNERWSRWAVSDMRCEPRFDILTPRRYVAPHERTHEQA